MENIMKKLLIGLALVSSFTASAVVLSKVDLGKYVTSVNISITEKGQIKACQKLDFALSSKQGKALSDTDRSHAEEVLDYFCDSSAQLTDTDIEKLVRSVKVISTKKDCRNLDFALQSDQSSEISQDVRTDGDEVLDYLCD
jgi:hypothetical protein